MSFLGRQLIRAIALPILSVCVAVTSATAAETHQADVVVYGDASGGVTAAVQAARMGKKLFLCRNTDTLVG